MIEESGLDRLNKIVSFAKENSPFYRLHIPFNKLENIDDFKEIPLLDQATLRKETNQSDCRLLTAKKEKCYVFASGGTTGDSKYIYRTPEENDVNVDYLAKGLKQSGLSDRDCVLNLLASGNLWTSLLTFNKALEKVEAMILSVGANAPIESIINYISFFKVTTLLGIPTQIISIANYLNQNQEKQIKVPKIVTGGEHLYQPAKDYLRQVLGVEEFLSTGYTSNETGAIGYQCRYCHDNVFHLHTDLQYLEIVDPETHVPLPPNESGMIVATNLNRKFMPIIRYAIGDMGRFIDGQCACGSQDIRFELLGRCDDKLRVGMANYISPLDVAECIGKIKDLSLHFQIEVKLNNNIDELIISVEALSSNFDKIYLQKALLEQIMNIPGLVEDVRLGYLHLPIILILPPNSIKRNPRTGKITRTIDNRGKL